MAALGMPPSDSTVRVRMVDTTAVMRVKAKSFIEPVQPGHEFINIYVAAYLIEHPPSGKKIMFDLGVRKDYWNLPAALQKRLGLVIPVLRVDKDVTDILTENDINLDQICSMELFPPSTDLIVGQGFTSSPSLLPAYPQNINSPVDSRALEGRKLVEIDFNDSGLNFGGFRAHDLFRDGSLYLLDTPGHCLGHMCALARATGGADSSFILLGGDICHFPGDFRPSPRRRLPDVLPDCVLDQDVFFPAPCPCSIFGDHHPQKADKASAIDPQSTPWYRVSTDPSAAYINVSLAQESVNKLISFDADPSILVCLAHDSTVLSRLPRFNDNPSDDLNDWKDRGFKDQVHWGWLNELPRDGKPGRGPNVEGFWRDGKPWPTAKEELQKLGEVAASAGL